MLAALFLSAATLTAETPVDGPEVITVWGRRTNQIGEAYAASEGEIDFGDFVDRPLLRVGELAEVVPGLAATQHSGTGKANQYFLRGFNLDHGTDFTISLDGMPLNLRTSAHGQGYLDINFLIPEIVETVRYRKGVASVDAGDFSAAGSAAFTTFQRLPENFVQAEIGENAWRRLVGGINLGSAGYAALDLTSDDGPWEQPENFEKFNGFLSLSFGRWTFSGGGYHARWDATDQIPQRAVDAGLVGRLGDIDDDVGGSTGRYWGNVAWRDDDGFAARGFIMRYDLNLFSDFTYFLNDPVNGDEFEQAERRWIFGGSATKVFAPVGAFTFRLGLDTRFDRLDPVGLYKTAERQRLSTVREDSVDQDSVGGFFDVAGNFGRLRIDLGARADFMRVDVRADNVLNSGRVSDAIVSPKGSIAWRLDDSLEAYASVGRGFHSNDARGATIHVDPVTGDAADPVPLLVRADGAEIGLRLERPHIKVSVALFGLDLDSELIYVGDAGSTEASDASRRLGVEATATWAPARWINFDASAAATRARLRIPGGGDRIPLATEYVVTGGLTVKPVENLTGTLTLRRVGPAPLTEDNSARSEASTVINGRLAYRWEKITVAFEALNLFNSKDADITYFYASRLPGEPPEGVEDIHFHPVPPRSFRLQTRLAF